LQLLSHPPRGGLFILLVGEKNGLKKERPGIPHLPRMLQFIRFLLLLALPSSGLVVQTECGGLRGFYDFLSSRYVFLGIPYAAPPTGGLRWKPTVSLKGARKCWNGTRLAFLPPPMCKQTTAWLGSEDCLYLSLSMPHNNPNNVKSSDDDDDDDDVSKNPNHGLLPVMVFFHGGDLTDGYSYVPGNIPSGLSGTISVLANYRLNAFGYLALDELAGRDPRGVSGNYGLLDQIEVLKWVKQNIRSFGGDPDRVTIYGQSSGGTSVYALMCSPRAKGLFSRAIAMSPSPRINATTEDANQMHKAPGGFVSRTSCNNYTSGNNRELLVDCLLQLSAREIAQAVVSEEWKFPFFGIPSNTTSSPPTVPLLLIDNDTLPLSFSQCFRNGPVTDVPLIIGTMREEVGMRSSSTRMA